MCSVGGARSTPRWTDPHRPSAGTHAVRRGSSINVGSGHGSRTLWCLRDSGLSCLTFTVVHLTSIAHLLTLQSLGHRPAIETSHLHHMYLHHVSSGSVTRDLHCWLVLVYAHFFFSAEESQWCFSMSGRFLSSEDSGSSSAPQAWS